MLCGSKEASFNAFGFSEGLGLCLSTCVMFTSMNHLQRFSIISSGSSHYVHTLLAQLSSLVSFFTLDFTTTPLHVRKRVHADSVLFEAAHRFSLTGSHTSRPAPKVPLATSQWQMNLTIWQVKKISVAYGKRK